MKTRLQSGNEIKVFKKFRPLLFCFLFFLFQTISPLSALIINEASIFDAKSNNPFFNAIKSKNLAAVQSLIQSGLDVNESNNNGQTPLMAAVFKGNIAIMKVLITAGADLEACDNNRNTPLMYAFYAPKEIKVAVEFLLSLKVNASATNKEQETPLILAASKDHCSSMKLLIAAGVNIDTKGGKGSLSSGTALMHAIDHESTGAAKLLIKHGANVETRDSWGFSPLMLAALRNDGVIIRALLKAGADINARTTKSIPVNVKKLPFEFDLFPKNIVDIPSGSTALDIAKQFKCHFAESVLKERR